MAKNIIIIILLILTAGAGYYAWDAQAKAAAREAEITTLEADLAELREAAADLEGELEATRTGLSEEVENLKVSLAEEEIEYMQVEGQLNETQSMIDHYIAQLRDAEEARMDVEGEVKALKNSLTDRNAEIEAMTEKMASLQAKYEATLAELSRLKDKLSAPTAMLSGGKEAAPTAKPTEPAETVETRRQPLPVGIETKKAFFSGIITATVANESPEAMTVAAELHGSGGELIGKKELVLKGNGEVKLGDKDGWTLESGQAIRLTHPDYAVYAYTIP